MILFSALIPFLNLFLDLRNFLTKYHKSPNLKLESSLIYTYTCLFVCHTLQLLVTRGYGVASKLSSQNDNPHEEQAAS